MGYLFLKKIKKNKITKEIFSIIPNDNLKKKRIKNLVKSYYILTISNKKEYIGILFIRKIIFIPNITWIIKKKYRKKNLATILLKKACKENFFLTAICRNIASIKLAKKNNFKFIFFSLCFYLKI